MRDLFAEEDLGTFTSSWTGPVYVHDVRAVRITPVTAQPQHRQAQYHLALYASLAEQTSQFSGCSLDSSGCSLYSSKTLRYSHEWTQPACNLHVQGVAAMAAARRSGAACKAPFRSKLDKRADGRTASEDGAPRILCTYE